MTDENPLLSPEEQADDVRLKAAIDSLSDHTGLDEPYARFWRLGQLTGYSLAQIGSNVAMAYFHGGTAYMKLATPDGADQQRCSAAFYDGFTDMYWATVTDKQKEGPYS